MSENTHDDDDPRPPTGHTPASGEPEDDDGTWQEWLLIGVIVLSFVVVPGLVLLNPPALPFQFAYLVLPLIPAILLGATAVWVALRGRAE